MENRRKQSAHFFLEPSIFIILFRPNTYEKIWYTIQEIVTFLFTCLKGCIMLWAL